MTTLNEKEAQLQERKRILESSIQELKDSLTADNIEQVARTIQGKAGEVSSLQTQLELTELAIKSTQDKLRARQEFEASKEYKDKRKMQEKLYSEAGKQAEKHFEQISSFIAELEETFNQVEQADRILYELAEDKMHAQHRFKQRVGEYARLRNIQGTLKSELQDRAYRMRRAQEMI